MKKGRQDTSSEGRVGVGGVCDMVTVVTQCPGGGPVLHKAAESHVEVY